MITVALIAGMVGCGGVEYDLTIASTTGGSVTIPGEGTFTYHQGTDVDLVAEAEEGYQFVNWTGDVDDIADVEYATTTITMNDDYSITADFTVKQYNLNTRSTEGGIVTTPGDGTFTYDYGMTVDLVAEAEEGYQFVNWTGNVNTIADVNAASTTITMNHYCSITANFAKEIWDWHDLNAIRENLGGSYVLMNDLDASTAGYGELASATANGGMGWQPIGSLLVDPLGGKYVVSVDPFTGTLTGQGYEIRDLCITRPDQDGVGLFGSVGRMGAIKNIGMTNAEVTGRMYVGSLAGQNLGNVDGSSSNGSVSGCGPVGGQIGSNHGTVSNCHSAGVVSGEWSAIGGLVGINPWGTVHNSCSIASVNGGDWVGGLVGANEWGTITSSYAGGSMTGERGVGGLLGRNWGIVSNSYYNLYEVLLNGQNVITIGALFSEDFEEWLANDKSLDINERLSREDGHYLIDDVIDLKQLLAFGQDDSLRFKLTNDLDLAAEPNFYVPYLAGEFHGYGHKISNLTFNFDFASQVGLFGYLASDAKVTQVCVQNTNVVGADEIGGLVGFSNGHVSNSCSSGKVAGYHRIGGLVGVIHLGVVSDSYASGSVAGDSAIGGLVGWQYYGTLANSHYNYDEVLINGENIITIGALFDEDFAQWLANGKSLDINESLSREDGYYLIDDVIDLKQLLAFGQDDSVRFRLTNDLDLVAEPNFYIPYFAGHFDGNGHKISNLSFSFTSVAEVGLFGYLASGAEVTRVSVENTNITGSEAIGALVGYNYRGTVSDSCSSGNVAGGGIVGGLVGRILAGTVQNSYSNAHVSGYWDTGGLVGSNKDGHLVNSYSTGSVVGHAGAGGLLGFNEGIVSNSFWDVQTSGTDESDGGTGKTTAEMRTMATFEEANWSIIAVIPGETNSEYTWNIVDGQTYPFLSWQSVS